MKSELANQLKEKYPQIFRDLWGNPRETCLAFGIECGAGWYDIIDRLCEGITKLDLGPQFKATQVKEKFGELRFYYSGVPEVKWGPMGELVAAAERESRETCEYCGSKEDVTCEGSWIKALCKKCRDEEKALIREAAALRKAVEQQKNG